MADHSMKIAVRTEVTTIVTVNGFPKREFHDCVEWEANDRKWDAVAALTRLVKNAYEFVERCAHERGVKV